MAPKPDNRKDNVDRIQRNINMTIQNMEIADELITLTDDPEERDRLMEKNDRRQQALNGMRHEIRDEARHQQQED
jgi:small acid-soluble spore protein (thioredoxin-like protein)